MVILPPYVMVFPTLFLFGVFMVILPPYFHGVSYTICGYGVGYTNMWIGVESTISNCWELWCGRHHP